MKKNILITGVSTGIGYAATKTFLQKGFFVFGSVRKHSDADRLKAEFGPNFHPLIFDVKDSQAIEAAAKEVEGKTLENGLFALVNNAGVVVQGPLQYVSEEQLNHQFEVNVMGLMRVIRAFLPLLGAKFPLRTRPGRIINISSVSGRFAMPFIGPYAASKFALEALSDALRRELTIFGIDVILLQPGPIKTPIWEKALNEKETYLETEYGPALTGMGKYIRKTEEQAIEVEVVADYILKAATLKKPRLRYIIAKNALFMKLLAFIPDRLLDRLTTKRLKEKILPD